MAESTYVQSNFTSGELSPRLFGRSDLSKYFNGAKLLENFIPQKHGGIIRRSGTRFIAEVKDSARLTRLIPFQFSVTQTYTLEFGNLYIRFYRDSGRLVQLSSDPSEGTITEVVSPYKDTDLREIKFTQSADVLYLCHPDYEVRKLQRTSGADTDPATWSLVVLDAQDGPYGIQNTDSSQQLTPSGTTGTITVTATGHTPFASTDVGSNGNTGRLIRIANGVTFGWVEITAFTSSTVVTAVVQSDIATTNAATTWRLGEWSDTTGWPHVANFHQSRLFFGPTDTKPQTTWASVVGDFNNLRPSDLAQIPLDDDSVVKTIDDDRVNTIRWIKSDTEGLITLTDGGPFIGRSAGDQQPITTGTDFFMKRQSTDGASATVRPHQVKNVLLFINSANRRVLEHVFRFDADRFVSPDLSILSEHITIGGVLDSEYQTEPDEILWLVRNDGQLLSMTYERDEQVVAWSRHIIGGTLSGASQAAVEAVALIREGNNDQLWMVVKRTIGGVTKRYIEFMDPNFAVDAKLEDAFFVDSGLNYDDVATSTITGLDHLDGETVQILADGAVHAERLVSGGRFTLDQDATKVSAGLGYPTQVETMPIIFPSQGQDSRGKQARSYRAFINFHNTMGGKIGSTDQLDEIIYREAGDDMSAPPPLFTGIKESEVTQSHDRQPSVKVTQDDPVPMTILNITIEGTVDGV